MLFYHIMDHNLWVSIINFKPNALYRKQSFGVSISMVVSIWVVIVTSGGYFSRWFRSLKEVCFSSFLFFPFVSFLTMMVGVFVLPSLVIDGAHYHGAHDLLVVLFEKRMNWLMRFLSILLYCNIIAVLTHIILNSVSNFKVVININKYFVLIILFALILLMVFFGIFRQVVLLVRVIGVIVPPIGAVIIVNQLASIIPNFNYAPCHHLAFFSWSAGVFFAIASIVFRTGYVDCVVGVISSFLVNCLGLLYLYMFCNSKNM